MATAPRTESSLYFADAAHDRRAAGGSLIAGIAIIALALPPYCWPVSPAFGAISLVLFMKSGIHLHQASKNTGYANRWKKWEAAHANPQIPSPAHRR